MVDYLIPKPSLYYLTHCWKDKGVYTFLTGNSLKVNVIALLGFALAYLDSAIQYFNHDAMGLMDIS